MQQAEGQRGPLITVVDFDAGNLHSVNRALLAVGQRTLITEDPRVVERAEALVLPGVGSAQDAMRKLRQRDLIGSLREYAASGRPFLGVCVGLQLLFDSSEEGGGVDCLGVLRGTVKRFPDAPGLKIPQIGWNSVRFRYDHPLLRDIPGDSFFYFVHSYYAQPADDEVTLAVSDHGIDFPAIVASENVLATQFHPEKSAELGLRIYANFGRIAAVHYERRDTLSANPVH